MAGSAAERVARVEAAPDVKGATAGVWVESGPLSYNGGSGLLLVDHPVVLLSTRAGRVLSAITSVKIRS